MLKVFAICYGTTFIGMNCPSEVCKASPAIWLIFMALIWATDLLAVWARDGSVKLFEYILTNNFSF